MSTPSSSNARDPRALDPRATRTYPVAEPHLDDRDRASLLAAFDSGWISSQGPMLEEFERGFAAHCGTKHALATSNGTTALHLALLALDLKPGDEVLVPSFTYVATANAVRYCGAKPVLVECEPDTWNIDPRAASAAVTPRTVGIIPVHLYGHPCDMRSLGALAERRDLWLVEDAAEAHGATVDGKRVGSFGDLGTFSLYGNKIITTGEGGVVTTDDDKLAARVKRLRGQGMDPERRYWFPEVGYNYRMTNLAAALGVSQLAKLDELVQKHREIGAWYRAALKDARELVLPVELPGCTNVHWLMCARLAAAENKPELRDEWMRRLAVDGIETRPFFHPMHTLPPYREPSRFPITDRIATSGINLPTSPYLTKQDVEWIASRVILHARDLATSGALPAPQRESSSALPSAVRTSR